jgi:very-short-patch-repair endonuclease
MRKPPKGKSLAELNPLLAKEWHPIKNGELTPSDVAGFSHKKVWWKCDKGEDHEWKIAIYNRSYGKNCPYCTLTPQSKQELTITFELLIIFKDINPRGFKTRINGKMWTIDIYIPELHLGIEFDGNYWHKDKRELDKLKTEQLNEEGFDIIRVRETPLEKIFATDVISSLPYNGKKVTDDVLRQIMKMKKFDSRKISQINNYIAKEKLQNEKGLDKYIDMILTEKGKH